MRARRKRLGHRTTAHAQEMTSRMRACEGKPKLTKIMFCCITLGDQEKDAGPILMTVTVTVMCKFLKNNYVRMRAKFRNVTKNGNFHGAYCLNLALTLAYCIYHIT